jgi:hypothetical protein
VEDPPPVTEGDGEVDGEGVPQEPIDQTLADTFPASDPPCWSPGAKS